MSDAHAEQVVLLDADGTAIGSAAKVTVHRADTPLHLAFSCYIFRDGRLLVTRRALDKVTFPGVWTNSACGHPAPGEDFRGACARRIREELGVRLDRLRVVLPGFRYRAEMNGVVENEICPVLAASTTDDERLNPAEVAEAEWVEWPAFRDDVLAGRRPISPWCAEQLPLLAALGDDPDDWTDTPASALPPAAREPALGVPRDLSP